MIDIKTAVKKAKVYLIDFFPEKADSIRLEETELNEDGNFWKVTLSFLEEKDKETMVKSPLSTIFEHQIATDYRVYKSLKVRAKDGEVLGMTIWKA
jgi:hypothetical protein